MENYDDYNVVLPGFKVFFFI